MEKMNIPTVNHHVGSTERVFVAHVNDLNDFYLHSELVRDSLLKLGQDLYNEYSDSLTNKPSEFNETLNIGDYCVCPSESEDWYRGLIRQIDSNGNAVVFKIDYGDVQCIPIQFLQPLHSRFNQLHRLAFHCSLANLIKPLDGWSSTVIEEFRSRLTTTFLYAKFINYNDMRDILEVEITEKSSKISLNKDFQQYQQQQLILPSNDKLLYKYIPLEKLDCNQPNQIRLLYYISPSHFYVYLRDSMTSYTALQTDLQIAIQNFQILSSTAKYLAVAVQDNHAIWHRAVILDSNPDLRKTCVYFIDIGQREYVSINSIRALPEEFQYKPAMAIPCRLLNVFPIDSKDPSKWQSVDPVHDEFNRLMTNVVSCKANRKHDQIIYDIEIDIPKIGDLGAFLSEKNLVSRQQMHNTRPTIHLGQPGQSYARAQLTSLGFTSPRQQTLRVTQPNEFYNNPNASTRPAPTRFSHAGFANNNMSSSSTTMTTSSSFHSPNVQQQPQEGIYKITQVHSAAEFYGVFEGRERDLEGLYKYLEDLYNSSMNDLSSNINSVMENTLYVVQQGEKYHRVLTKRRDGDTRVSVKLIDRGDDIIVDKSELLMIDPKSASISPFAVPFRLRGYDESQNSPNITRTLKKFILNQRVHISKVDQIINGCYTVDVISLDNQYINGILFQNEKALSSPPSRPNFNQSQQPVIETQIFSNSTRNHATAGQDVTRHLAMGQRTNDTSTTSSNMFSGASRSQPGRFSTTTTNPPGSIVSPTKESMPRFSNTTNRSNQPTTPNSAWNREQTNNSNFTSASNNHNTSPNQQSFPRQQTGSSNFGNNQRNEQMQTNQHRFSSAQHDNQQGSFEQKRSFASGSAHDDRSNETSGFRRNGTNNMSRGSGFSDRGGRGGFNDRPTTYRTNNNYNNDNNSNSSGGPPRRGGGFGDRGNRNGGGGFQDRNNDHYGNNNNNMSRSQNFNNNRGGFQNRRDDRGGSRGGSRGGFNDNRNNFRGRNETGIQLTSDFDNSSKSFSGFKITREVPDYFQAGDQFIEQKEIPKDTFKFVISHIETANDFYIQLVSKGDELSKLTETLQIEYDQAPQIELNKFKMNEPCLAKSSDKCWYRAIVISPDSNKLKVRFVDFGDSTEVNPETIRLLAKKHCEAAPYAYRCSLENIEVHDNVNIEKIINQCFRKDFSGKIKTKTADQRFILESDDFLKLLKSENAIKIKSQVTLKRIPCAVVHIESDQHQFCIQDDDDTVDKISHLIEKEEPNAPTLTIDEVKQLPPNSIVIARYDEDPFRAIIQSEESDDNVIVCYVDFGNSESCPKTSLKRCSEQLSSFKYQSKRCQFYGIPSNKLNEIFAHLENASDSKNIEISIVKEKNQLYDVLLYVDGKCVNEKFGCDLNSIETVEIDNQPPAPTTTTVVEEQPLPSVVEKPMEEIVTLSNETPEVVNLENEQAEIEESPSEHNQGLLTHVEPTKPYIYVQLIPESEPIIEQINLLINNIVEENSHNSSYKVGEHVIAKYSQDKNYYRARIESYSESSDTYTVYFLDYGNTDENVTVDNLYSNSNELEKIEPQAHGYLLNNVSMEMWSNKLQEIMEGKINYVIEFSFVDETNSIIDVKFDDDINNTEQIQSSSFNEQNKIFPATISATDNDCFYIHRLPEDNLNICELEDSIQTCDKQRKHIWNQDDLCLVCDDQDKFYRGKILSIDSDKYNVKCIDYGNKFESLNDDRLFILPNDELFQQLPLAHQCRLNGVDDIMQIKIIDEIIKNIPETERVTIDVENELNDPCWLVKLTRENNEIVNDRYVSNDINGSDKEIEKSSDNIEKNATTDLANNDEQPSSEIDIPQNETTSSESASIIVPIPIDQSIDISINDPSITNVTKSGETNDSIVSD